ncbi:MAG TPA: response regulator [Stellaceae bacterium]|nr:response regulator [Stellaceae bacterium]
MNPAELRRVLYVDDEPDIQEVARLTLELTAHLIVKTCGSGGQALAEAATFAPDLILLDVMMPDMDGPATLAALRAEPELTDIPIIFITATVQRSEIERLRELGAIGVILKPFDPLKLADQLKELWAPR